MIRVTLQSLKVECFVVSSLSLLPLRVAGLWLSGKGTVCRWSGFGGASGSKLILTRFGVDWYVDYR